MLLFGIGPFSAGTRRAGTMKVGHRPYLSIAPTIKAGAVGLGRSSGEKDAFWMIVPVGSERDGALFFNYI